MSAYQHDERQQAICDKIRTWMDENQITVKGLAKMTGLSAGTLSRCIGSAPTYPISQKTARRIALSMGVNVDDLCKYDAPKSPDWKEDPADADPRRLSYKTMRENELAHQKKADYFSALIKDLDKKVLDRVIEELPDIARENGFEAWFEAGKMFVFKETRREVLFVSAGLHAKGRFTIYRKPIELSYIPDNQVVVIYGQIDGRDFAYGFGKDFADVLDINHKEKVSHMLVMTDDLLKSTTGLDVTQFKLL
ncbi:helix-turn-helix domain-containing protein [Ferrimonas balearica]|uniref:helix-turn-helix domain-containing protein n=1 Tax=Ferrimonas balearica TaxID=44012 RepID=UPI001C99EF49|nr:helix-turn-helix transcriptional regulator [Ferrimonas balearica]MBY5992493.1 helix-turn-helix transcriptional regulator [Ferrimonas balearica]